MMQRTAPMYVVYLDERGVQAHQQVKEDATDILLTDPSIKPVIAPLKPEEIRPITLKDVKSISDLPVQENKKTTTWPNHRIENIYALEALEKIAKENALDGIPCIQVNANGNRPGGYRIDRGQEESILQNSNLGYGMRDSYPQDDIWNGLGGIYAVLCRSKHGNLFWSVVSAAPNLNDYTIDFKVGERTIKTPSDAALFGRDPLRPWILSKSEEFMRHIIGEVLMQFLMVKNLKSRVYMTGLFGCSMFGGNPEYYAAAVRLVSQLPMFSDIRVCYAYGKNNEAISGREYNAIFSKPLAEMIAVADKVFKKNYAHLCQGEPAITLQEISKTVLDHYRAAPNVKSEAIPTPVNQSFSLSNFLGAIFSSSTPRNPPHSMELDQYKAPDKKPGK